MTHWVPFHNLSVCRKPGETDTKDVYSKGAKPSLQENNKLFLGIRNILIKYYTAPGKLSCQNINIIILFSGLFYLVAHF